MKACSLIDLPCHIGAWIAPFVTYIVWGFWIVVALVALWALSKLKEIGGWPAVVAGVAGMAAFAGYVFGRKTMKVATRGGKQTLTRDQIMALQRALAAKHLYPGEIDGKFGAQSQAGMKAYQRMRGEQQTGFPTYEQLRDLGIYLPRQ